MSSQGNSLLQELSGIRSIVGASIAVVQTEWNHGIVSELHAGCLAACRLVGVNISHTAVVPGAVELPFACRKVYDAFAGRADAPEAIVAFGAVIRGGTPHFDYVCQSVTYGLTQLNLILPIPIIFGVLTLDNMTQAEERLGGVHGHKGHEAGITAMKMIHFNRQLNQQ